MRSPKKRFSGFSGNLYEKQSGTSKIAIFPEIAISGTLYVAQMMRWNRLRNLSTQPEPVNQRQHSASTTRRQRSTYPHGVNNRTSTLLNRYEFGYVESFQLRIRNFQFLCS